MLRARSEGATHVGRRQTPAGPLHTIAALVDKELRLALRIKHRWVTSLVVGCTVFALATLISAPATSGNGLHPAGSPCGLVWLTLALVSVVISQLVYDVERDDGCWDQMMVSPLPAWQVFVAKFVISCCLLTVVAVVLWLQAGLMGFFDSLSHPTLLLAATGLGCWGLAATTTLVRGIEMRSRHRSLSVVLFVLAIQLPLLLGASALTELALQSTMAEAGRWLALLAAFDLLFTWLGIVLFVWIVED